MSKTLLRQKIWLVLFGVFLCLVLLEMGLRIVGFIILSLQEHRNLQSIKQKGTYRIICLGESTTAGQWPPFLEEILNQRNIGIKFSVIDKGVPGHNTSIILATLESNLNEYHPNMVITMMGINDLGAHIPYETVTTSKIILFFRSFRTYKLTRLLWLHIVTKLKETGLYKLKIGGQRTSELQPSLLKSELKESHAKEIDSPLSEESFKKAIELNPRNDEAYAGLGRRYRDQGKFSQAEESFKKAIELNPGDYGACIQLGWVYMIQGKFSQAEELFKKTIELIPQDDRLYGALELLYEEMGNPELARKYEKKVEELRLNYYDPVIINNFRKLKEILDKKGIRLICVQYPLRSIEPLKKLFDSTAGVIFVENKKIFEDALRHGKYEDYFVDNFGGEFGHCTPLGNKLITENVANVILKEVFNK